MGDENETDSAAVLPRLMETAARLLDEAGELEPVTVDLHLHSPGIQLKGGSFRSIAAARSAIDRIGEVLGVPPALKPVTGRIFSYQASGEWEGVPVHAMALTPPGPNPFLTNPATRVTTTAQTAALLRSLAQWAAGLDTARVRSLIVHEDKDGHHVQICVRNEQDQQGVAEAVIGHLPNKIEHHGSGHALLPTGHTLRIDTV
ncbi:hypothetical protein [Streptomyces sp. NBC_00470]|uniref:hypothetical protein n=1 Tax=Streptomyces sp. NBC_00470 TaxID=2975753 RepID=UPI002F906FF1